MDTEITVERSPDVVWAYFTKPENWEKWWGGGVKAAQWREGGRVEWALGGASPISEYIAGKRVTLAGGWMSTTFTFAPGARGTTVVSINEGTPQGGASYNDGGAAHLRQMQASLAKLKDHVERETASKASTPAAAPAYTCPHCGTALQGGALITVMASMQAEVVDFQTACSSCGRTITKREIEAAQRKGARTAASTTKKWWEFWK